jgi:hypothetical protein
MRVRLRIRPTSRPARTWFGVRRGVVITRTRLRRVRWEDAPTVTRWREWASMRELGRYDRDDEFDRKLGLLIEVGWCDLPDDPIAWERAAEPTEWPSWSGR